MPINSESYKIEDIKYSVLMSIYVKENPDYFIESIESMIHQSVRPDEIIIVKDGILTEALDEVIDKYKKKFGDLFTIVTLKENVGLGRALNEGLKISRNELVARMDTDDISMPNRCEVQLEQFRRNKELCICGTQILEFIGTVENIVSERRVPLSNDEIKKFSRRRSPFNHVSVMYKRSVIISEGGYCGYRRKEDLDLFFRMVNGGYDTCNVPVPLVLVRIGDDNLRRRSTWVNCSEYISIMFKFYKKGYIEHGDMVYVLIGQLAMYLLPRTIVRRLNNKFLRSQDWKSYEQ